MGLNLEQLETRDCPSSTPAFGLLGRPAGGIPLGPDNVVQFSVDVTQEIRIGAVGAYSQIIEALENWSRYVPIHFVEVEATHPTSSEVPLIEFFDDYLPDFDRGILAQTYLASPEYPNVNQVVFDTGVAWSLEPTLPVLYVDRENLQQVIGHETGHVLGLAHANRDVHSVMSSLVDDDNASLRPTADDIWGVRSLYGDGRGSVTRLPGRAYEPPAPFYHEAGPSLVTSFDSATGIWSVPGQEPFPYGLPNWIPVVGDWDGDGSESIGVVDPTTATWYLRNEVGHGRPDAGIFQYGLPGWVPTTGKWGGDSFTGIGMYDPSQQKYYLSDYACASFARWEFTKQSPYYPSLLGG